jgi:formylmethanofuran dehydrogenase subunit E
MSGKTKIDQFRKIVNDAAANKTNLMIRNGSYAHAQILFDKIIESAKNNISIITEKCNEYFYGKESVYAPLLRFIDEYKGNGKIRIIFEKEINEDKIKRNPFIIKLVEHYNKHDKVDSLKICKLNDNSVIAADNGKFHLLLADKDAYRFEVHMKYEMKETIETSWQEIRTDAVANFGDEESSLSLWNFFEKQLSNNTTKIAFQ